MSIEIHAREDWTANRITLHVFAAGTATAGAQIYVDLSPEQAERLAKQLLEQAKRYRELDAAAEKDLGPKFAPRTTVRLRSGLPGCERGIVSGTRADDGYVVVDWSRPGYPGGVGSTGEKPEDLEVIEASPKTTFQEGCRVRMSGSKSITGIVTQASQNGVVEVQWDGLGHVPMQECYLEEVVEDAPKNKKTVFDKEVIQEGEKPKILPGMRVQHRYDLHLVGTVEEGVASEGRIPVLWGKVQGVSWHKPENLQEVSPDFAPKRLRVRLKTRPDVTGTIVEGDRNNPLAVDIDGAGTLYVDGQELQVIE